MGSLTTRLTIAMAVLAFVLSTAPVHAAPLNGEANSFGTLAPTYRPVAENGEAHIEARVVLDDASGYRASHVMMFSLTSRSDEARVTEISIASSDGSVLERVQSDEDAAEVKMFFHADRVPDDGVILAEGRLATAGGGSYWVEIFVIAFNADYSTFQTQQGEPAALYGHTEPRDLSRSDNPLAPPVQGLGNDAAPLIWILAPIAGATAIWALSRWALRSRGHATPGDGTPE